MINRSIISFSAARSDTSEVAPWCFPVRPRLRRVERGISSRLDGDLDVDGIVFCAEEILYDATGWWRWVFRQLARQGMQANYDCFYQVWRRDYLDGVNRRGVEYWDAFRSFLGSIGCCQTQINELMLAAVPRRAQFEQEIRRIPSVQQAIASLRQSGIRLFALSCSPLTEERLWRRLTQVRLADQFAGVHSAWSLRRAGSDSSLYHELSQRIRIPTIRLAIVGCDSIEMEAAASAGMTTISQVRDQDQWSHVRIDDLSFLPIWMNSCSGQQRAA